MATAPTSIVPAPELYVPDPVRARTVAAAVARILSLRTGEVAVLGLGVSGVAAAKLLRHAGFDVYAMDDASGERVARTAAGLAAHGVHCDVGSHDLDRIARAQLVVVSPGIPPEAPAVAAARRANVPVVSEVEVGLRLMPTVRTIVVTGTNGKTTTTALIGHLLRALGHDAVDAGNIGVPVCELVLRQPQPTWLALELSSFQLHDAPGLQPDVGVLTTLSADHLDRYPSVEAYYADKARLFANAESGSRWITTADSAEVEEMMRSVAGACARVSLLRSDADGWYDRNADTLMIDGAPLIARRQLALMGDHNVANALMAVLSVMRANAAHRTPAARRTMAEALTTFRALPHRLQTVHEHNDVQFINDSKATNVSSTLVAIAGMTRPTVLLLGGRHKGEPYTALAPAIAEHVRHVLCFGEAGAMAAADLRGALTSSSPAVEQMENATFEGVVARACAIAEPGDAVLLSPACSSFDMFANYVERGIRFAELAREHR